MPFKNKIKFIISSTLVIIALLSAQFIFASCSLPEVSFEEIIISEDIQEESSEPVNPKNEFDVNAKKIVATVKYMGAKGADSWRFKWVNTDLNDTVLDSMQQFNKEQPDSYFQGIVSSDIFTSDRSKIIAPGSYRVEFYYNDKLLKTTAFKIIKPGTKIIEVSLSDEIDQFGKPLNPSKQFKPHDTVYLSVKLDYAIAGNALKAVWETSGQKRLEEMGQDIKTDYYDNSYVWFAFSLPDKKYEISPGLYAVKIFLNDTLYESLKFEVLKEDPPTFALRDYYNNKQFGFNIAIPDNWSYEEKSENDILLIKFSPQINIPAYFTLAAASANALKPYDEFIKADALAISQENNWSFVESKKREYLLKNTYATLELIFLYKDKDNKSFIAVYSVTEHNDNALIYHILIEDEIYSEFAETAYSEMLDTLTFEQE